MAVTTYLPASAQSLLVALGYLTPQQAALEYSKVMELARSGSAPIVYGAYQMAAREDQLKAFQAEFEAAVGQMEINNLAEEVWQVREKIMSAPWPSDVSAQKQLIELLNADAATGMPPDPPANNVPSTIDQDEIASIKAGVQAQLDAANALYSKLSSLTATGETVDWPTSGAAEAAMGAWLKAQGIADADLTTDTNWLKSTDSTTFTLSEITSEWSFPTGEGQVLFKLVNRADSPYVIYDKNKGDGGQFFVVDGDISDVQNTNINGLRNFTTYYSESDKTTRQTTRLDWPDVLDTVYENFRIYPYNGDSAAIITKYDSLPTLQPELGKKYEINGKQVSLWSDGTTVYKMVPGDTRLYVLDKGIDQAAFKEAQKSGNALEAFGEPGVAEFDNYTPVITAVEGDRRAAWKTSFREKSSALEKSNSALSTTLSIESPRITEALQNWNVSCTFLTNQLKALFDALKSFSSKI